MQQRLEFLSTTNYALTQKIVERYITLAATSLIYLKEGNGHIGQVLNFALRDKGLYCFLCIQMTQMQSSFVHGYMIC